MLRQPSQIADDGSRIGGQSSCTLASQIGTAHVKAGLAETALYHFATS
jgi:hypothetical protein